MSDWVYGGLLYGILLLLCTPIPGRDWPSSILAICLRFIGNSLHRYRKDDDGLKSKRLRTSGAHHIPTNG
jgi:hypothetical protein